MFKPLKPRDYLSTKGVVSRLYAQAGGVKHVAHLLERSDTTATAYSDPNDAAQISFDQVRRLTEARGCAAAAEDLAALAGGYFTPLTPCEASLEAMIARGEDEHAAFASRLFAVIAPGGAARLGPRTRGELAREIDEMTRAYLALRLRLAEGGDGR